MAVGCLLSGCAIRGNVGLLENELRIREDRLADAERRLNQTESELQLSRKEANSLRDQLAKGGDSALLPEQAELLNKANGLKFGGLLTTGVDRDEVPGDEILSVLLMPHDGDGGLVKLAGTLRIEALDLAETGEKQKLGEWSYSVAQTRELWHSGFFAAGYLTEIPWKRAPTHPEVTLHARLTTLDGRTFDATQLLQVKPLTEAAALQASQTRKRVSSRKPTSSGGVEFSDDIETLPDALEVRDPFGDDEDEEESPPAGPANRNKRPPIDTSDRFTEPQIPTYR